MPSNIVLAKAVPQQGHWTASFSLHHRCNSIQKACSPLWPFASYLWTLKATPNLESRLQQWQIQSASQKGARKPTTQVNQFAYWRAVSDWFYAVPEDTATLLFFWIQIRSWFSLLEIDPLWPITHCSKGLYFNSLYIIPFPFIYLFIISYSTNYFEKKHLLAI